jgi:hypothetical protein
LAGKTFTEYKDIIITGIVGDTNLLKALTIKEQNFLDESLIILPKNIPYNYVFPYKINPDILTEPKSVITMSFVGFKFDGATFKEGKVYFYTICHESLIRTYQGNRYDYIYEQLKSLFNNNRTLGLGKAIMSETSDLPVNSTHLGNVCCLEIFDFGG